MTPMNERGFTLTELLVSMAMLGMILGGVYTLQQQGLYSYQMGAAKVEAQQNARGAMDLMIRELRSATSVTAIAASDVSFGDQSTPTKTVRYNLSGANLQRTVDGVADVLIGGTTNLAFTYLASDGSVTAAPGSVATIVITITTKPQSTTSSSTNALQQQMVVQDQVRLRNMP